LAERTQFREQVIEGEAVGFGFSRPMIVEPQQAGRARKAERLIVILIMSAASSMVFAVIMLPEIAVMVAIPAVIMFEPSAISFPIAGIELSPIVAWSDPASFWIRNVCPVSAVPRIAASNRIPVAIDPHKIGAGPCWHNANDARRRRWSDSDSDRNLRKR